MTKEFKTTDTKWLNNKDGVEIPVDQYEKSMERIQKIMKQQTKDMKKKRTTKDD